MLEFVFCFFLGAKLVLSIESWWFAVPLVNILLAMRELLLDRVIIEHVLVWLISSIIYAGLAAWFAARQFKREDLVASIS